MLLYRYHIVNELHTQLRECPHMLSSNVLLVLITMRPYTPQSDNEVEARVKEKLGNVDVGVWKDNAQYHENIKRVHTRVVAVVKRIHHTMRITQSKHTVGTFSHPHYCSS